MARFRHVTRPGFDFHGQNFLAPVLSLFNASSPWTRITNKSRILYMILDKKDHRPPRNDYGETLTAPPDGVKAETEIPSLSFSSLYNGLDAERSNEPQRPSAAGGRGKKLPQAALNPASRPPPGGRSRARSVARFRARSTELRSAFEHDKQYITNIAQRFLFLPRSTHMVMTSDASDADRAASDASDADRAACRCSPSVDATALSTMVASIGA